MQRLTRLKGSQFNWQLVRSVFASPQSTCRAVLVCTVPEQDASANPRATQVQWLALAVAISCDAIAKDLSGKYTVQVSTHHDLHARTSQHGFSSDRCAPTASLACMRVDIISAYGRETCISLGGVCVLLQGFGDG